MSRLDWEKANRRDKARDRVVRESMAVSKAKAHGRKKTTDRQIRYMGYLAARYETSTTGLECCAMHSSQWIDGVKALASESFYERNSQPKGAEAPIV